MLPTARADTLPDATCSSVRTAPLALAATARKAPSTACTSASAVTTVRGLSAAGGLSIWTDTPPRSSDTLALPFSAVPWVKKEATAPPSTSRNLSSSSMR